MTDTRTPTTAAGRALLPWVAASHFNRGGLLPAEAHDRAVADILAIEAEARTPVEPEGLITALGELRNLHEYVHTASPWATCEVCSIIRAALSEGADR